MQLLFLCIAVECLLAFILKKPRPGGTLGTQRNALDQGRISGISWWGEDNDPAFPGIIIKTWESDQQTTTQQFGNELIDKNCTPFTLAANEYIDGYRYQHGGSNSKQLIRMIGFHTSADAYHECNISNFSAVVNVIDTNYILFSHAYLTGFIVHDTEVIDSIQFQFTEFNNLTFITDAYGGEGGSTHEILDQGKIYAIEFWGYRTCSGACFSGPIIVSWSSTNKTDYTLFGYDYWINGNCTAFSLPYHLYIDGYRIIYDKDMVHYIGFHVSDGTIKECFWPEYDMSSSTDTGWIIHSPSHFLSGFFVRSGGVIDLIAFQFSNLLLLPTNESTTDPTIYPTIHPTILTSDPTIYPTTDPTSDPTVYPSNTPTLHLTTENPTEDEGQQIETTNQEISPSSKEANTENNTSNTLNMIYILIGSIGLLCCMVILLGFIFYIKKKRKRLNDNNMLQNQSTLSTEKTAHVEMNATPKEPLSVNEGDVISPTTERDNSTTEDLYDKVLATGGNNIVDENTPGNEVNDENDAEVEQLYDAHNHNHETVGSVTTEK